MKTVRDKDLRPLLERLIRRLGGAEFQYELCLSVRDEHRYVGVHKVGKGKVEKNRITKLEEKVP